jgi:FKBP-type peptidyl-prolyl cis-trans isomerase SlyD
MLTVCDDLVVSLDYTLRLSDGQIVDSSSGHGPLSFVQGKGYIIPGLEKAIYGMAPGEEKDVVVASCDVCGEFDAELLESLPRSLFPADMVLEQGQGFRMRSDSGHVVVAYIHSVEGDQVTVDLNHPLAGETLYFSVKVADLREATAEELAAYDSPSGCSACGSACSEEEGCEEGCGQEGCCEQ